MILNKKRIFIALPISNKLNLQITKWEKPYIQKYKNLKWVSPEKLHITLVPPWYVENPENIINKLKSVKVPSIDLQFDHIQAGPNQKKPRLLWALGKTPEKLVKLINHLHKTLDIPMEPRPFLLHLTLAKVKPGTLNHFEETIDWSDRIEKFVLLESILSKDGSKYKKLADFSLY